VVIIYLFGKDWKSQLEQELGRAAAAAFF